MKEGELQRVLKQHLRSEQSLAVPGNYQIRDLKTIDDKGRYIVTILLGPTYRKKKH